MLEWAFGPNTCLSLQDSRLLKTLATSLSKDVQCKFTTELTTFTCQHFVSFPRRFASSHLNYCEWRELLWAFPRNTTQWPCSVPNQDLLNQSSARSPKISLVILLTVCHTILMIKFREFGIGSTYSSLIDIFFILTTCLLDIVLIL